MPGTAKHLQQGVRRVDARKKKIRKNPSCRAKYVALLVSVDQQDRFSKTNVKQFPGKANAKRMQISN